MNFKYAFTVLVIFLSISCSEKKEEIKEIIKPVITEQIKEEVIVVKEKEITGDAHYSSISGGVSHKRSKKVVWEESSKETNLFLKDWVKTDDGSKATISMNKNRIIRMAENSRLILLDKQDNKKIKRAVIGVSKGDVEGEIDGEDGVESELILKTPNAWVKVKSSLRQGVKKIFRISLTNDKMKIHVQKGDVEVLTKGKVIKLTENKVYQRKISPATKEVDFTKQLEPPAEIKEVVVKKKSIIFKNLVKKFEITYPGSGNTFELESIVVKGVIPNGQEVVYKGKPLKVVNNMFSVKVDLKMGTNIVTFQVINGDKVSYKTLELERK